MEATQTQRETFPASGVCKCGSQEWFDTESGYVRMSNATIEDGVFEVMLDGWDDMSEGGAEHYATCAGCFAEYELPNIEVRYV